MCFRYKAVFHLYIYTFIFRFFSHIDYHRILSRVPCDIQYSPCWLLSKGQRICLPMQDTRDTGSVPESGRSPGEGIGSPLQYSCLEQFYGQTSLVSYHAGGHRVSDVTTQTSTYIVVCICQSQIPDFNLLPASPSHSISLLVIISLFSISVNLFLFCK